MSIKFVNECTTFKTNRDSAIAAKREEVEAKKVVVNQKKETADNLKNAYLSEMTKAAETAYKEAYADFDAAMKDYMVDMDLLNHLMDKEHKFQCDSDRIIEEFTSYMVANASGETVLEFNNKLDELKAILTREMEKQEEIASYVAKTVNVIKDINLPEGDHVDIPYAIMNIASQNTIRFVPGDIAKMFNITPIYKRPSILYPDGTVETISLSISNIINS